MTDLQKYLVDEALEDYQEGHMSRRQALKLIAGITGSAAIANTLLAACSPPPAATVAQPTAASVATSAATLAPTGQPQPTMPSVPDSVRVPADDPDLVAGPVEFPAEDATVLGYLARPTGEGPFTAVLVCHENRGLTAHIEDVARRLAKTGYAALAVDLLSREGGSASLVEDDIPAMLGNAPDEQFVGDFIAGWTYLESQPFVRPGTVGMVGFCFGGGITWRVAAALPAVAAAVPFYGPPVDAAAVPGIQAAVLAVYAGNDDRINQTLPDIEAAMAANDKVFEAVTYPDVDHAFHNDTRERYNAEAAQAAWQRTLDWFQEHLGAP
jgi:carboxymethylenebutenolidase